MSPQYKNAPIKEAVFDIKIDPMLKVKPKAIEELHSKISKDYPTKEPVRVVEAHIELQGDKTLKSSSVDKGVSGYRFWNKEKTQVCLFKLDGFTYSRLKPYEGWDKSFLEAIRLWEIYQKEFSPAFIKRLAVRNINTLEIPSLKFELEEYFKQPPKPPMPEESYDTALNFVSRFDVVIEGGVRAIITLTPHTQSIQNTTTILFDTDVFNDLSGKPVKATDRGNISLLFSRLRTVKNDIFEQTLTDKMKELFDA